MRDGIIAPEKFEIRVVSGMPFSKYIADGRYTKIRSVISPLIRSFPVERHHEEVVTVRFATFRDPMVYVEDCFEKIREMGLRPVGLAEILTFGVQHPEEQRGNPILGLGRSGKSDHMLLIMLRSWMKEREIIISHTPYQEALVAVNHRFAVVKLTREIPPATEGERRGASEFLDAIEAMTEIDELTVTQT